MKKNFGGIETLNGQNLIIYLKLKEIKNQVY